MKENTVTIMIVDDSDAYRETLERRFARNRFNAETPYRVISASSAAEAIEKIAAWDGEIDAFLVDIRMETDHAGITLIEYIRRKERFRYSPIVVITGQPGEYSEARIEREHLIHGYIDKSDNVDVLEQVRAIVAQHRIARRSEQGRLRDDIERLMGSSPAIRRTYEQVEEIARMERPVIYIDGETGTGKTLIAEYFHDLAGRGGPFIDYNVSLPVGADENILKSILFGARRGFLAADHKGNEGLIAQAEGGTLFLDEFQNVGGEVQAMLIKVIESGRYRSLGSEETRSANVNFLFAGNRDVEALVRAGVVREDFFYRIHDVVKVPPLRRRREDIAWFVNRFLQESNRRLHKYVSVAPAVVARLEEYEWPGNVRQLKNVVERAVLHSRGFEITWDDIRLGRNADGGGNGHGGLGYGGNGHGGLGYGGNGHGGLGYAEVARGEDMGEGEVRGDFFAELSALIDRHAGQNRDAFSSKNPKDRSVFIDFDTYRRLLPRKVMEATGGNKKATAQLLGLTIEQLATLIKTPSTR
jgi:two-component system response regulator HydG